MPRPASPLLLALLVSCHASGVAPAGAEGFSLVETASARPIGVAEAAALLGDHDVVFLGELHQSDGAHAAQLALVEALAASRGPLAISLEQFERDVQPVLDAYLAGAIDEAELLATARPWRNYGAHYRPVVELARARGWPVVAANAPRELVRAAGRGELASVLGDPRIANDLDLGPSAYREAFRGAMANHPGATEADLDNMYAAQVLRDETMALAIAEVRGRAGTSPPLVVHLCGRFHSDRGMGTVERLLRRQPTLRVAVVSTVASEQLDRDLTDEELGLGALVVLVPPE